MCYYYTAKNNRCSPVQYVPEGIFICQLLEVERLTDEKVPIHLKMALTIKEAAEYSNIGINKIDQMLKQPNCPFVLFIGTRKLVKRREFEEFIHNKLII